MNGTIDLDLLQSVFNYSPDGIIILDKNALIKNYNNAFIKLTAEIKDTSFYGKKFPDLLHKNSKNEAVADFNYLLKNETIPNCEYQYTNGKGKEIDIEVSYSVPYYKDKEIDFVILYLRDISKRKIDQRAMEKAKARAQKADMLKTSFLANMSHEIRTPVNAILGFADLLDDEYTTKEEISEYINIINSNGKALLNLINDIIDVAKIESNQLKINKQKFKIRELFKEVYESMLDYMANHESDNLKLAYYIEEELKESYIETDEFRLRQILINLLSNAIKFTNEGEVKFGVKPYENRIMFNVSDTGKGLTKNEASFIFERFRQIDEDATAGGTGLGLTITKNLVELLKGKIWVDSNKGEGSDFYFTLPVNILNDKTPESKSGKLIEGKLQNKNILIVEDSETNYQLLSVVLKKQGADIIWATKGEQAINICKNHKEIDLVLMDINLPDKNGYEVTQIIKSEYPKLPVIAQTAYAMAGEKEKSLSFGCDDYISKPLDIQKLIKKVEKQLTI